MVRGGIGAVLALVAALVFVPAAWAPYHTPGDGGMGDGGEAPAAEVDAEGNFTDGLVGDPLGFDPAKVRVKVGQVVRWTNTDILVPHTSTEDHGLWDLGGDYGLPLIGPFGYGPGESVRREFEAGTHSYFCEVHPEQMHGVVKVPVKLRERRDKVVAIWSAQAPPQGREFDVQRKRDGGGWQDLLHGTTARKVKFEGGGVGTVWRVRTRLRSADDPEKRTGYSPTAKIRVG